MLSFLALTQAIGGRFKAYCNLICHNCQSFRVGYVSPIDYFEAWAFFGGVGISRLSVVVKDIMWSLACDIVRNIKLVGE